MSVNTKALVEWSREHLEWYKETPLAGGYSIGRGGRQTGHCENYCEMLIKDDNLIMTLSPIDKGAYSESETLGDVLSSLQKKLGEHRNAVTQLEELISILSTEYASKPLGSRYTKEKAEQ